MPPLEVKDLIEEVRDGHVFLSLLEVLLGTTLVSLVVVTFGDVMNVSNSRQQKPLSRLIFLRPFLLMFCCLLDACLHIGLLIV